MIGKEHKHLLRDIRGYAAILEERGLPNFGPSSFFIESSYINTQNKEMPCYLISKMGCEMVANKLNGEKGVLFTAAYVSRFNEMEARERLEQSAINHTCGCNTAAQIIIPVIFEAGAAPMQLDEFLYSDYEPLEIIIPVRRFTGPVRTWSASDIANMLGVFSINGKPHRLAISAVVYMLGIEKGHKTLVPALNGMYPGYCVRYDDVTAVLVKEWFEEHGYPTEIACGNRVFKLRYSK